jgi:hypothetical protein
VHRRGGQRLAPVAWALALAALSAAAPACAAPLSVEVSVEPSVATIGDRLQYTLVLDYEEGVEVELPDVVRGLAPFDVLDATVTDPLAQSGRVVERRDMVVAAFEVGELWLPALEIGYVTAEGDSGSVWSDSLAVTIESVLPEVREDEQVGPKDIKPPLELPRRIWPWIVTALAIAAAGVGAYFLQKWLRNRRREPVEEKKEEPPVPRIAAHVVALERLDALEQDDPIGRGEVPRFYVRVTEIVRLYLRDRFGVDAIDMTTSELKPAMLDARIEEKEIDWSERYLAHADLSKFAKHVPTEERACADFAEAREFVERTRLRGEAVDAAGAVESDAEDAGSGVPGGPENAAVADPDAGEERP